MKKSEFRDLIREEIKNTLNEGNAEFEELISKLVGMAATGAIDNNDIANLNRELMSARRKMFAAKQQPNRAAATAKGKQTKQWNALISKADEETAKALNVKSSGKNFADSYALAINSYIDSKDTNKKELQKKYNKKFTEILTKLAADAGLGPVTAETDPLGKTAKA